MIEQPFKQEQFTATEFDSAANKARWANRMASWVQRGFPPNGWNHFLYHGLYQHMYGHIAHYNMGGFYGTWFETPAKQLEWLQYAHRGGSHPMFPGDPAYCWSDVERAFTMWIRSREDIIAALASRIAERQRELELGQLAALKAKYEYPDQLEQGYVESDIVYFMEDDA